MDVLADWFDRDRERAERLIRAFRDTYGSLPEVIVDAPVRANLIGEHTDYNGLPVLPVAMDRGLRIAAASRGDHVIQLRNADVRFPPRSYALERAIPPFAAGDWGNYHKAGVQECLGQGELDDWRGGDYLVEGDAPTAAGLGTSSALVVAGALAFLALNGREVTRPALAERLARAERYVGTLSGGMDQAMSLLARQGHALRIDFLPLAIRAVPLPEDMGLVVCHSLVEASKSGAAREAYNRRVVECRLACRAFDKVLSDDLDAPLAHMGELARRHPDRSLESFLPPLAALLPEEPVSLEQLASLLESETEELARANEVPESMTEELSILPRARHVLTEADRVKRAERCLKAGDLQSLGRLMDASHRSCRDDYEVSCRELDELVEAALAAGALGARLTGAGFGGCTVNLLRRGQVPEFLETMAGRFYAPRLPAGDPTTPYAFAIEARGGARVARL